MRIEPSAVTAVEVITATRIIVETSVKAARIVGAVGKGAEKENYRAESYGVPFRKRGDETHGQTSPQQPQLSSGTEIPKNERESGTGGYRVCMHCKKLNKQWHPCNSTKAPLTAPRSSSYNS